MSITSNFCVILGWHMRAHSCLTSHVSVTLHLSVWSWLVQLDLLRSYFTKNGDFSFKRARCCTRSNVRMENHHRRLIQRLESVRTTQSRCVCGIKRLLKSLKLSWVSSRLGKTKQFRLCCDGFFYVKMMMLHKHNVTTVNFVDYTEIKIKI